jgi:hypothetical protein
MEMIQIAGKLADNFYSEQAKYSSKSIHDKSAIFTDNYFGRLFIL